MEAVLSLKVKKAKMPLGSWILLIVCVLFAFLCLFPLWILIANSTRSTEQIRTTISLMPSVHVFRNIKALIDTGFPLGSGFFNSLYIAIACTLLCVYFSALTAYGFAAYQFKAKRILYGVILGSMLIPGQLGMIGWYQLVVDLRLFDSHIPLIVPAIASASTVFFFRQYLEATFSKDLVEAARIDGSHEFVTFNRIILPIMVPALATMAIFCIIGSWNSYLGPIMILQTESKLTLPVLLQGIRANVYATDYGAMYAGIMLTVLPLIIMYLSFSKLIIRGVALGGVKE